MEIACARVKPNINNEGWIALKTALVDLLVKSVRWVRPLAICCVSGHSSGAVDLLLTTIAIQCSLTEIPTFHDLPRKMNVSPSTPGCPRGMDAHEPV